MTVAVPDPPPPPGEFYVDELLTCNHAASHALTAATGLLHFSGCCEL